MHYNINYIDNNLYTLNRYIYDYGYTYIFDHTYYIFDITTIGTYTILFCIHLHFFCVFCVLGYVEDQVDANLTFICSNPAGVYHIL